MPKIKCICIDDEPLALTKIESFIGKAPFLELIASYHSGTEALEHLLSYREELIFLDIQMPDINGLELLKSLPYRPYVILTSAYGEYALDGYDLDVVDFLLKPYSYERFLKAVGKVMDRNQAPELLEYVFIKTENRNQKVNHADIMFIKGERDYLKIVTTDGNLMTLSGFREMEQLLPAGNFLRVHRSFVVSVKHIESIERDRIRIGRELIPIGGKYRDEVYERLKLKA